MVVVPRERDTESGLYRPVAVYGLLFSGMWRRFTSEPADPIVGEPGPRIAVTAERLAPG